MSLPLVRITPQDGESPGSVLLRGAIHNGWHNILSFIGSHGLVDTNKASYKQCVTIMKNKIQWEQASLNLGLNGKFVESTYYSLSGVTKRSDLNYLGLLVPYSDLNIYHPSICPLCIKEKPFAPKLWDHKLITGCLKHKVELISKCPSCHDELVWNRIGFLTCKCEYDLNKVKLKTIDPAHVEYIEQLFIHKDQKVLNRLSGLFDDLKAFYSYLETTATPDYLTKLTVMSLVDTNGFIDEVCKLVIKLAKLKGAHPRLSLVCFLSSKSEETKNLTKLILEKIKSNYVYINKTLTINFETIDLKEAASILGVSMHIVKLLISENILIAQRKTPNAKWMVNVKSLNSLLIELSKGKKPKDDYISLSNYFRTPGVVGTISGIISQILSGSMMYSKMDLETGILSIKIKMNIHQEKYDSYLTVADVAKLCSVNYENIRFAIHSGVIPRINPKLTKGMTIYVDKKTAHNFHNKFVFAGALTKEFKNTTNFTDKLIASGVHPVSGPQIDGGLAYLFKRKDVDKLDLNKVAKLKNYKSKSGRRKISDEMIDDNSISLKYIKRKLNITNSQVISLINKGHLIKIDDKLRKVSVAAESFNRLNEIITDNSLVTFEAASTHTNESIKQFILRWIDSKFIKAIDITIERYVSKESLNKILDFKKGFVTSDEAGRITNTHSTHMLNLEKQGLINVAKKIRSQYLTINFYAIEDVLRVAKN